MSRLHIAAARCARGRFAWLKSSIVAVLLVQLSACAHAPPGHGPVPDYGPGKPPHTASWTYPENPNWGQECVGPGLPQQSPIDFTRFRPTAWDKSTVVAQGSFNDHDQNISLVPSLGPPVSISPGVGGTPAANYTVAGFHFHAGREHVIAGNPVLEMHIKTTDGDGKTAVFGVLWAEDSRYVADPAIKATTDFFNSPQGAPAAVDVGRLLGLFAQYDFYSYVGSLTTPPCTTGIRWYVLKDPLRTSPGSVTALRNAMRARGIPANNVRGPKTVLSEADVYLVTPK